MANSGERKFHGGTFSSFMIPNLIPGVDEERKAKTVSAQACPSESYPVHAYFPK